MGSLMAGWDSSFQDPKKVTYQRNKSLTKGEIAAYWKSMNKPEENDENQENMREGSMQELKRSQSLPLTDKMKASLIPGSKDGGDEKLSKINCWWTRSNWAFLNEPPVMATEGPSRTPKIIRSLAEVISDVFIVEKDENIKFEEPEMVVIGKRSRMACIKESIRYHADFRFPK